MLWGEGGCSPALVSHEIRLQGLDRPQIGGGAWNPQQREAARIRESGKHCRGQATTVWARTSFALLPSSHSPQSIFPGATVMMQGWAPRNSSIFQNSPSLLQVTEADKSECCPGISAPGIQDTGGPFGEVNVGKETWGLRWSHFLSTFSRLSREKLTHREGELRREAVSKARSPWGQLALSPTLDEVLGKFL